MGIEVAHHHYRAMLATAGVKHGKIPQPLTIPRPTPWAPEPDQTTAPTRPPRRDGRRHATSVNQVASVLSAAFRPSRG